MNKWNRLNTPGVKWFGINAPQRVWRKPVEAIFQRLSTPFPCSIILYLWEQTMFEHLRQQFEMESNTMKIGKYAERANKTGLQYWWKKNGKYAANKINRKPYLVHVNHLIHTFFGIANIMRLISISYVKYQ